MVLWLREATEHRLVLNWQYEPESFELFPPATYPEVKQLKTKEKLVARCLHRGASYTPDFILTLTKDGKRMLFDTFKAAILSDTLSSGYEIWIDVKGSFNPNDQPRYFSVIQKAMYHINHIWVLRITPFYKKAGKPKGLFSDTRAPEKCRYMQRGPLNACGRACPNAEEFLRKQCSRW